MIYCTQNSLYGKRYLTLLAVALVATQRAYAQTPSVIFDSITGNSSFGVLGSGSIPRSFMGESIGTNIASGPVTITGIDLRLAVQSTSFISFNAIRANIYFWNNVNVSTANAFGDLAGIVTVPVSGTFQTPGPMGVFAIPTQTFTTPVTVKSPTFGITINYQGDSGSGFQNTNVLFSALNVGGNGPSVGSITAPFASPNLGYYRNASGRTDGNFSASDAENVGTSSHIATRLYGFASGAAAPEPTSAVYLLLTGTVSFSLRKLAQRKRNLL